MNKPSTKLYIGVSAREDALDRFEAAWHLASGRAAPPPLALLSFADLPLLVKSLTPARWALLKRLKAAGPLTVFALAKLLERDYKNVHTDVGQLISLGLIQKTEENLVQVAWDAIRADFKL